MIVAARDAGAVTAESIHAICREASSLRAELVVAAPTGSREATLAVGVGKLVTCDGDPLVPKLWKAGIEASSGELLVLTIAQCVPEPGWLAALVSALEPDCAAAGGPIVLRSRRPAVAAVFFLRYSPYLLPFQRHDVADVPGDNAIYRRSAIATVADRWEHGFWENEVNAALRSRGARLVLDLRPATALRTGGGVWAFCRQRFRHGRVFGAWRAATGGRWRAVLAPLVPLLMLTRIVRRLPTADRITFVLSLPFLVTYLCAWTAGETIGLLEGRR
ncbi:MAG: hypothetical protein KatS3mg060_1684 [Dehalococcoidia bacterium]|nr:MAG: hypothetical protein KatS3mg060_1684 [Dehalococcoidia bacterium]